MSKTKAFTLSDSFISGIMADMGCDCGKTAPHWVPNTMWGNRRITPEQAIRYKNGWLCSVCGKHAWRKYERCSGCGSTFADFTDAGTSPE
jgi:predicted amidophosphoribosyltransferase